MHLIVDSVTFVEHLKSTQPSITAKIIQRNFVHLGAEHVPALSTINKIARDKLGYTYKKIQKSERDDVKRFLNFWQLCQTLKLFLRLFGSRSTSLRITTLRF